MFPDREPFEEIWTQIDLWKLKTADKTELTGMINLDCK